MSGRSLGSSVTTAAFAPASLAVALLAFVGCIARAPFVPDDGTIETSSDVNTERLRLRIDADGDNRLDADLPIAPLTFDHTARVAPLIEQAGVAALHANVNFETGSVIVIPAGHPVSSLFDVMLTEASMKAHGLLVLRRAADAAGIPELPDLVAIAGPDQTVNPGDSVTLDGSASSNIAAGTRTQYAWVQTGGPEVALEGANLVQATFVAPEAANADAALTFELRLDNGIETSVDQLVITVSSGAGPGGDPAAGEQAYAGAGCATCHGSSGEGGAAPALAGADRTEGLEQRFGGGAAHFGTTLAEEDIANVAAWLRGDSDGGQTTEGPCDVAGANADEGEAVFASCAACHGADGSGASAPSLLAADPTPLLESRFGGGMNHFGATLSDDDLRDVACWLSTAD